MEVIFWLFCFMFLLYVIFSFCFSVVLVIHDPYNWIHNIKLGFSWPYIVYKVAKGE